MSATTPSSPRALLELRDLTVEAPGVFGERQVALRRVSLAVAPGEILVLAGERGSGKSLLARLVAGFADPRAKVLGGSAIFDGHSLTGRGRHRAGRLRRGPLAAIVDAGTAPPPPGLRVGQWLSRLPRPRPAIPRSRIDCLHGAGLHELGELLPLSLEDLPPLTQKRLALFRALLQGARLLVSDGVELDLDPPGAAAYRETLLRLKDEFGLAVLATSGSLAGVEGFADRVAVFFEGGLLESGPAAETIASPRFRYTREFRACAPTLNRQARDSRPISKEALREAEAAIHQPVTSLGNSLSDSAIR